MIFGMRNAADNASAAPVLRQVQADGRLDGLLFEMNVRQVYRNASRDVLEVVYTFPLAMGSVLLGLEVELAGRKLAGVVVARAEAQAQYEEAMAGGDAPIMLERTGDGIYTVNLGNIKPGEDVLVAYRYAQLLQVEQGQVRLCIPNTIAPRYGDPVADAGLQPHQVPHASLSAQYRLTLALALEGEWAQAEIACPSHRHSTETDAGTTMLRLGQNAWLDRDVVVTLHGRAPASAGRCAWDADQHVVLASLLPSTPPGMVDRLDLKLLVDCSGSMAGDSIASARIALGCVADQLGAADRFTFSRFGSEVMHGFGRLTPVRPTNLAMLQALIETTDATLGGTEMQAALSSTIRLAGTGEHADILLVTDGAIWDVDPMIADAAGAGHRVFIVGLGAAPAESALRRLADATGGACEFTTPGDNLRAAIERMFARIRQQPRGAARVVWRDGRTTLTPDWVVGLPRCVFGGDTVHVFAGFSGATPTFVHLAHARSDGEPETSCSAAIAPCPATVDVVARMAAAARLHGAAVPDALALALRYHLVSHHTSYIVVHQRAWGDKVEDMASLHGVPSMLAAGWGGAGSVGVAGCAPALFSGVPRGPAPVAPASPAMAVRSRAGTCDPAKAMTNDALLSMALGLLAGGSLARLADTLDRQPVEPAVTDCLDVLVELGLDRDTAWTMLTRWLAELSVAEMAALIEQAIEARLAHVSGEQWRGAMLALPKYLPETRAME